MFTIEICRYFVLLLKLITYFITISILLQAIVRFIIENLENHLISANPVDYGKVLAVHQGEASELAGAT